ncbi:MAG: lysine--tRNA ligase [Spirochaetes bacterium]|nr:lysine--tRNA ligase [Spirochaetota bacterium]
MENTAPNEKAVRIAKIKTLQERGIDPYPAAFHVTHQSKAVKENFEAFEKDKTALTIAGRIMLMRVMGKASFATVKDASGNIQLYVTRDNLGEETYDVFKKLVDIGDIVGATGEAFKTRTGEISIIVKSFTLLTKAISPLPEKFHGLTDTETRYRQRYIDLIMNDDVRQSFVLRSRIVKHIRDLLGTRGFVEVETPMMQVIPGGAKARPFVTHHNALNMDMYLRIAPELYLKRLIVGGMERVFELNRNFRNEGVSTKHNPEFTMMEVYQAYADCGDMMELTESIFGSICDTFIGSRKVPYQETELDFTAPWKRIPMAQAVKDHTGLDFYAMNNEQAAAEAKKLGIEVKGTPDKFVIMTLVFEEKVEAHLIQPTFITDFPQVVSPLAKRKKDNPELVDRFELFIYGREMGNAFSELNDPIDQRARFEEQVKERAGGDEEAMFMDEDFVNALEHGMPPAGGLGIGIDRLIMLFINSGSIRDTILFPHMRA